MQFQARIHKRGSVMAAVRVDAHDAADARRRLEASGHLVVSLRPAITLGSLLQRREARFPLLAFSRELLSLVGSGLSIVESVETLVEKEARPAVKSALLAIHQGLHQGLALSDTLQRQPAVFPPIFVATVRASERTGGLEEALARYIAYGSQLETLRARLVQAAIYPALLMAVSLIVVLFLMAYVVPRFAHIYADVGSQLPWLSRWLLQAGSLLERNVVALVAALAAVLMLPVVLGRRGGTVPTLMALAWRAPGLGERLRVFALTRLYRTLGLLLRGGIALLPALQMVAGLLPAPLTAAMTQAMRAIAEGAPMSRAFDEAGLATPVALRMMRVGERAGNMGEMLERIAVFHDEEMAQWAEWVTRLLGPLLMLVMGLLIGAIVVLMYLPIFQLADAVR